MEHITREEAYDLLKKYNKDPFHIQHALTIEAVMKWYANELGFADEAEYWGIVGLLHDIDFELLNDDSIDKIFLIGRFKYDLATRLSYANIDPKKIILVNDTKELLNYLKEYKHQNIYTMVWTDVIKELKTMIKDEENEN